MRKLTTMILFFLTLGVVNAQEPNTLVINKTNGSVLKVFIDDIDHISYEYNDPFEMVVEAESTITAGELTDPGFNGTRIVLWSDNVNVPDFAEYNVTVPDETAYSFTLEMLNWGSPAIIVPLSMEVNGVDQGTADVPAAGGDVIFTGINLNAGSNTIKFSTGVIPAGRDNVSLPFDLFTITAY